MENRGVVLFLEKRGDVCVCIEKRSDVCVWRRGVWFCVSVCTLTKCSSTV